MHRFLIFAVLAVSLVPHFTIADIDGFRTYPSHPGLNVERTKRLVHLRMCEMPPFPAHGWYRTNGIAKGPGDQVRDRLLTYSCDRGYTLVGSKQVRCKHGEWMSDFPECEDMSVQENPAIPVNTSPNEIGRGNPVLDQPADNTGSILQTLVQELAQIFGPEEMKSVFNSLNLNRS